MTDKPDSFLRDVDFLLLVDDWKGNALTSPRTPTYYGGRLVSVSDSKCAALHRLLGLSGAATWHASGDRKTHHFLFDSLAFDEILDFLNTADTSLFDFQADVGEFESPMAKSHWKDFLSSHPERMPHWNVSNPYAHSFVCFLQQLKAHLAQRLATGSRVRVVTNQVDWIPPDASSLTRIAPGLVLLGSSDVDIAIEVWGIVDKCAPCALPYLPLLGLVDSEIWAYGRLNTLRLPGGGIFRERYLDWKDRGSPHGETVISDEDFNQACEPHRQHRPLLNYWNALRTWTGNGKSISL